MEKFIPPEKLATHISYGSLATRTSGTAVLVGLQKHSNSPLMAVIAMTTEEAKAHAADLMRVVIAIENGVDPSTLNL